MRYSIDVTSLNISQSMRCFTTPYNFVALRFKGYFNFEKKLRKVIILGMILNINYKKECVMSYRIHFLLIETCLTKYLVVKGVIPSKARVRKLSRLILYP